MIENEESELFDFQFKNIGGQPQPDPNYPQIDPNELPPKDNPYQ